MDIIKIAVLGISGVFLALLLKEQKSIYGELIGLVVCAMIGIYMLGKIQIVLDHFKQLQNLLQIHEEYFSLILKMTGITFAAEFAVNICKDAGHQAIGTQIELFAKLAILILGFPMITAFLKTIGELI